MQHFPMEILIQIASSDCLDPDDLRNASLLFRAMAAATQSLLFRQVTIRSLKDWRAFFEVIKNNPILSTYTKILAVLFRSTIQSHWLFGIEGRQLASRCSHITRLELSQIAFSTTDESKSIRAVFSIFRAVEHLHLCDSTFGDISHLHAFLMCFRLTLRHLTLMRLVRPARSPTNSFGWDEVRGRLLARSSPALASIESLIMRRMDIPFWHDWLVYSGAVHTIKSLEMGLSARSASNVVSILFDEQKGRSVLERLTLYVDGVKSKIDTRPLPPVLLQRLKSFSIHGVVRPAWLITADLMAAFLQSGTVERIELHIDYFYLRDRDSFWWQALGALDNDLATEAQFRRVKEVWVDATYDYLPSCMEMELLLPRSSDRGVLRTYVVSPHI